jgi:hypothetical protein
MTPTLFGRWQTRFLLLTTVGTVVTLPFMLGYIGSGASFSFVWILGYVAIFGVVWDVVYDYLQKFRWDRDWPGVLQLLAGTWEAVFLAVVLKIFNLPGVPQETLLSWFALHYGLVWLGMYVSAQVIMRILFPRWRFYGGQWL